MAVHMIRVHFEPPKGDAQNAVDNWVTNFTEWTGDPVAHSIGETNTQMDGSGTTYVTGDYRFEQDATATEILDDLSARLQKINGGLWHRLTYHVCDHDEDEPGGCSWDQKVEYGTIPSDIPDYTVN